MLKKSDLKITLSLLICIFFLTGGLVGCRTMHNPERNAVEGLQGLIMDRIRTQPYGVGIMECVWNDFQITESAEESYTIQGNYALSYGMQPDDVFLYVTIEETASITRDGDGGWYYLQEPVRKVAESSLAEKNGKLITGLDESRYIAYLSKDDVGSYLETEAIAYKLCSDYMYQVGTRLQEKTSFMITGSTSLADFVSLPVENADGGILNCWKVQSSFDGLYVGYMEPFGVSVPFLDIGSDGEINNMSIPVTFRMEETECGYRLFSVQTE